jgi:hypothetical protein
MAHRGYSCGVQYINSSFVLFQVVIEAVDETGAVLPEAVSAGASAELTKDFTTGEQVIVTRLPYYCRLYYCAAVHRNPNKLWRSNSIFYL